MFGGSKSHFKNSKFVHLNRPPKFLRQKTEKEIVQNSFENTSSFNCIDCKKSVSEVKKFFIKIITIF